MDESPAWKKIHNELLTAKGQDDLVNTYNDWAETYDKVSDKADKAQAYTCIYSWLSTLYTWHEYSGWLYGKTHQ